MRRGRSSRPTSEPSACSAGRRRRGGGGPPRRCARRGEARGGVLGHHVDPALDRREQVLEARQRRGLPSERSGSRAPLSSAPRSSSGCEGSKREARSSRASVSTRMPCAKSRTCEMTCRRSHRAWRNRRRAPARAWPVQGQLIVGDLEVATEVGEVLRQDRRVAVGHDRDATSPPPTTSVDSRPTTWPSWWRRANRRRCASGDRLRRSCPACRRGPAGRGPRSVRRRCSWRRVRRAPARWGGSRSPRHRG